MNKRNKIRQAEISNEFDGINAGDRNMSIYSPKKSSRNGVVIFKIAIFLIAGTVVLAAFYLANGLIGIEAIIAALVVALLALSSMHIALNWEKVVILRFGKLNRVAGPGLYFTIPIVEHGTIRVDQRIITTPFFAERTLTVDLVPINIDAVLFWVVWDAEKACSEVEDYFAAVSFLAQAAMREAIGRSSVAEVALRRDQLDIEIKEAIEKEASSWGLDIISVKVRDIVLPAELQEVMSLEAQAEREKNARMALAGIEGEIAEMLAEAATSYNDPDAALKLRTMLILYETVKKSKGTVVTIPSSISDGLGDASVDKILNALKE
jgi:regulator of protease activity HflC (stomatin/prohibitin superfamily)